VAPTEVLLEIGDQDYWLTLGCFNIIVHSGVGQQAENLVAWATANGVNYERWLIEDGRLAEQEYSQPRAEDGSWRADLVTIAELPVASELEELVKEYAPLMASALSRSGQVIPTMVEDLSQVAAFVRAKLPRGKSEVGITPHEGLKLLTTLNAGLSRFSSQAYSGITPVAETECHFWSHSLLGTGVANLALWRFCRFVDGVFSNAAIPYRVAEYKKLPAPSQHLDAMQDPDPFLDQDFLSKIPITAERLQEPVYRPVTCFSGRDGFKSTLHTVSAPLAVITACNSMRWTLLTLTHELSHNIIRGVLGKLYPLPYPDDVTKATELLTAKRGPQSLFEAIQRSLLLAAYGIQQMEEGSPRVGLEPATMQDVLQRWHHEIEEIMVHVFDFLYFYGADTKKYVQSIWLSWSVIPNIGVRVPEYVLRTLCAIMANHLRRGKKTEDLTRDRVLEEMKALHQTGEGGEYIAQAVDYLERDWTAIKQRLLMRRPLVQLVKSFLYSELTAAELRGDPYATGGSAARGRNGYEANYLEFSDMPIGNPLTFVDAYTGTTRGSAAHSLWMLYMLAFNVRGTNG
jgi:hypothetical protein